MSNLEYERRGNRWGDGMEEWPTLEGFETMGNPTISSIYAVFGAGFMPPGDFGTPFDLESSLVGTDYQDLNFLSLEPAPHVNEPADFPISSSSDWSITEHAQQYWLDVEYAGSTGSAGTGYTGIQSTEASSPSALSSPASWDFLGSMSPGAQSSCIPFNPATIATGCEGALVPNDRALSERTSPRPLAPAPSSIRHKSRSREIKGGRRKRVKVTMREKRKHDKPEKCHVCGKGSQYIKDRKRHEKRHEKMADRKRVHCPYCEKSFLADHPYNLKRHIKKKHPDQAAELC